MTDEEKIDLQVDLEGDLAALHGLRMRLAVLREKVRTNSQIDAVDLERIQQLQQLLSDATQMLLKLLSRRVAV